MPGLLDTFFGNADQTAALGLLGAQMMGGNTAQGFAQASSLLADAPRKKLQQQLLEAQIAETLAQQAERAANAKKQQAALEQAARLQQGIPGLFRQPGMAGGEPQPQTEGGVPMFSRPMQAGPMQATPGGFDVQAAIRLGMDPKMIAEYAGLQNIGRQKVARTVKGVGADGREFEYQLDEFGQKVGDGMPQYRAPISVNRGNSNDFLDPYTLQPKASLKTFQSPDSVASNATTMRGQNMTDARTREGQMMTDARAREANNAGKVPAGYRLAANGNGLEFIPGGPADPNAAKKAAPTEFQGKSASYGMRAQESDKILSSLDGQYSPSAVNAKTALEKTPLIGGVAGGLANLALSDSGQKAEQAQRDFINAVLRQESGAAIGKDEFENAKKQYFPQPFDSAAVKAQKAHNRQLVIQGFMNNARPGAIENTGGATGGWAIREKK